MSQKKDICRFTIQFNPADPCHQKVIELLNSQGRSKAQFIANAVTHYMHCSQTPEIPQNVSAYNIKDMIVEAVNQYMSNKEKNERGKGTEQTKIQNNSESISYDDLPFDENDMKAIADTITMFKAK